ncbi:alpha/beta fold hydrolase [Phytoactinopolyspora halotolerans]|uniref:Alpha/beta hydrolase n=1 Tax=Phytoactinopolyspora halotolerans TaxID=1981512 RepID=A0A6L9S773_9ACTN|nr:alpha/beta hydrolase [Phytoactinopolyspora halotolerans]NEE00422.1 alpha/beta hydrolase [Phytoactinopolyspora halotolerans]
MNTTTDMFVQNGQLPIAVREYGGSGQPVILLHGAGGDMSAWDSVGPTLAAGLRPVAIDLRGHGTSGDGPWSWDAALSDLEAVADELDLRRPAVAGHSLGGSLAARWAHRHPECPAVVSLDGHRAPVTSQDNYDPEAAGLTTQELDHLVTRLNAMFDAQAATSNRPRADMMEALRASVQSDSLPVFAELTVPVLLVLATRSMPGLPAELEPLMVAFRAGLRRDVEALAASHSHLHVREIDGTHGLLFEMPTEVAEMISTFVARATA